MALNLFPESEAPGIARKNFRAVERHLGDYYEVWLDPASFQLTGPTLVGGAAGGRFPTLSMPDGSTSTARHTLWRRSQWVGGRVQARVFYTADGASTNDFELGFGLFEGATGGTMLTSNLFSGGSITTAPGPASADDLLEVTVLSDGEYTRAGGPLGFRIQRRGAAAGDTNTNNFHLVGVLLRFLNKVRGAQ